ncbi:hypothetical protein BH11MYX4_BH11MYX4_04560 [soil metagenome]
MVDGIDPAGAQPGTPLGAAAEGPTPAPLDLAPLPSEVTHLLAGLGAPPRLAAHLRAVHDVALRLTVALPLAWPALTIDAAAIAFGAATHDIGKALHLGELTGPAASTRAGGRRTSSGASSLAWPASPASRRGRCSPGSTRSSRTSRSTPTLALRFRVRSISVSAKASSLSGGARDMLGR